MSIIKYIEIELADLVKDCNLILEVTYVEPFAEEVSIKNVDPNVQLPYFKKEGCVFSVTNVLKNADKIDLPKTIQVPNEEWRRSLSQHKARHAGTPNKSYSVKQYKSHVKSMRKSSILFLHHFQGTFELESKNSFESVDALDKITMLIKAK